MTTKTTPKTPVRANGPAGLVGLYFHTFVQVEDGCWACHYQGHIDSLVRDDLLLVTLFEWLMGYPNTTEFLSVDDLVKGRAEFYDNAEDWRNAPQYGGGLVLSSRRHWDHHDAPRPPLRPRPTAPSAEAATAAPSSDI